MLAKVADTANVVFKLFATFANFFSFFNIVNFYVECESLKLSVFFLFGPFGENFLRSVRFSFFLGWAHAWHFDESPFSTTIMLQTAREGGHFEHTLPIRGGRGGGNKNNKMVIYRP